MDKEKLGILAPLAEETEELDDEECGFFYYDGEEEDYDYDDDDDEYDDDEVDYEDI